MPETEQVSMKIVLLGDPSVGKTSLIKKYVLDIFHDQYLSTLGTKVTTKKLLFPGKSTNNNIELTLIIWDVMGQSGYKLIHESAFQSSKGAIIVCDLTRKETFQNSTPIRKKPWKRHEIVKKKWWGFRLTPWIIWAAMQLDGLSIAA